jgi:hypothetical protein
MPALVSSSSSTLPELRLRRGEDRRLRAGHLWIFSNEIDTAATPLAGFEPGAQVRIVGDRGHPLGVGYLNPATLIAARILARDTESVVGRDWMSARLRQALNLRESLYPSPHYRWVFGESDGLPGLVLDRYGDIVVGQIATLGITLEERLGRANPRGFARGYRDGLGYGSRGGAGTRASSGWSCLVVHRGACRWTENGLVL